MLRVGVISDTHGSAEWIRAAAEALPDADAWIHLGDYASDAEYLAELAGVDVYAVNGNCSFSCNPLPTEKVLTLGGVRLFITHGHTYGVEFDRTRLAYRAEELCCAAALYGHTHVPNVEMSGRVLIMNPGSPARPRGSAPRTIGLLAIADGRPDVRTIRL